MALQLNVICCVCIKYMQIIYIHIIDIISHNIIYEEGKKGRKFHPCHTLFGNFTDRLIDTLKYSVRSYCPSMLISEFFLPAHRKTKIYMELPFCNLQDKATVSFLASKSLKFQYSHSVMRCKHRTSVRWMRPLSLCQQCLVSY